ncbi:hypothetical protein SAMN05414139_10630 [Burkholderia sp. D7]|jgi:hypothetical protein|nr:hypothetical protein SAMN05414139_10630 [Burkholderia sp. D7]
MSPIELIRIVYRFRRELKPQLAILAAVAAILSYHIMTNPLFEWLSR